MSYNPLHGLGALQNASEIISTRQDAPRRSLDEWLRDNQNVVGTLASVFPTLWCTINPRACAATVNTQTIELTDRQNQGPNWLLVGGIGIAVVLLLIIILKK